MKRSSFVMLSIAVLLFSHDPSGAQMSPGPVGPHEALDGLDTRRPLPLVPMMADHQKQAMRDHLAAVQEIVAAALASDFPAVERAAGRIGYSNQMNQMCTQMGAGAPGFTEQALNFHHTADTISVAAQQRDRDGVLRALSETLKTCTGCHATWKQQVVDDTAWSRITGGEGARSPATP